MNIANLLVRAGRSAAERPALALGGKVVASYGDLALRAAAIAGGLRTRFGLAPGDRVALAMRNAPQYVEALFAIWHAGLIAVPMNAKLHAREFAYVLAHSGARVCLVTDDLAEAVESVRAEAPELQAVLSVEGAEWRALASGDAMDMAARDPRDGAWLFYTSGTTGRPKGALLSHRNLLAMTTAYFTDVDAVAPGDSIVHAAPMSHGSGLYILPHVAGCAVQVVPESGKFEPDEIFGLIRAHRGVSFFAAPTMVHRLVASPAVATADLANLKTIVYGGGPMYVEDAKRAIEALGPRLAQIYGQGESPMTITALAKWRIADRAHPRWEQRLASVGVPHSVVEVRVVDDEDRPLPAGAVGEVAVRGDVVMEGYWRDPEATARTLKGGWLRTGDVGSFDEDGFLTLRDRSKDVIISGGSNIYPREVEEVLLRHPAVAEVSVIGQPDPEWGEAVVAFVVAAPGRTVSVEDLDRLCVENIARFKRPKAYRFVEALPRNNYGKVLKTALREMLAR